MENISEPTQKIQQAAYKYLGIIMDEIHNGDSDKKKKPNCIKVLKGFAQFCKGFEHFPIEAFRK